MPLHAASIAQRPFVLFSTLHIPTCHILVQMLKVCTHTQMHTHIHTHTHTHTYSFSDSFPLQVTIRYWASLVAQVVKNPPAMQETWVQPLGWEDSLEKEMATLSSILAWEIPWTAEPGRPQSMWSQRVGHD